MQMIVVVTFTLGGLQPHPGNGNPSEPNGQGASKPGTPMKKTKKKLYLK